MLKKVKPPKFAEISKGVGVWIYFVVYMFLYLKPFVGTLNILPKFIPDYNFVPKK